MNWEVWTMKSRTSFFDGTLLRKDITRFSPVWLLYLIGGTLLSWGSMVYNEPGWNLRTYNSTIGPMGIVNMCYALIAAECLFGDLFNTRMCNGLHALPRRRETFFITHVTAGVLFSLVPTPVVTLVQMLFLGEHWYVSFYWLLAMELQYLFFFGLAVLCALSTGSRFGQVLLYALLDLLVVLLYSFVTAFYVPLLPGLVVRFDGFQQFCPVYHLASMDEYLKVQAVDPDVFYYEREYVFNGLGEGWGYMAALAVLGVVLLGLALLLYRKRKLESAGDLLAFRWMEPIGSVLLTFSVAVVFRMIGQTMDLEWVFLAAGTLIGLFGSEMLLRRTVRVFDRKSLIKLAAIAGTFLLTLGLTWLDPLGTTRWVPQAEKVAQIEVAEREYLYPDGTTTYQDPADIRLLVDYHHQLIHDNPLFRSSEYSEEASIYLRYTMTDGSVAERMYCYDWDTDLGQSLNKLMNSPQAVLGMPDLETALDRLEWCHLYGEEMDRKEFSPSQSQGLVKALWEDLEAGRYVDTRRNDPVLYNIELHFQEDGQQYFTYLEIGEEMTATVEWIRAHEDLTASFWLGLEDLPTFQQSIGAYSVYDSAGNALVSFADVDPGELAAAIWEDLEAGRYDSILPTEEVLFTVRFELFQGQDIWQVDLLVGKSMTATLAYLEGMIFSE